MLLLGRREFGCLNECHLLRKNLKQVYISVHGWFKPYWSYTQDPGIHMCVRAAIVHIIYSKMGIDQMPNFKTVT